MRRPRKHLITRILEQRTTRASFGLYIHNDTMSALGRPQDMFSDTAIQLQPVFAQWIQESLGFVNQMHKLKKKWTKIR